VTHAVVTLGLPATWQLSEERTPRICFRSVNDRTYVPCDALLLLPHADGPTAQLPLVALVDDFSRFLFGMRAVLTTEAVAGLRLPFCRVVR
jgi:hypothetical protein